MEIFAFEAICRVDVPANPCSANNFSEISSILPRVSFFLFFIDGKISCFFINRSIDFFIFDNNLKIECQEKISSHTLGKQCVPMRMRCAGSRIKGNKRRE